MTGVQTCALPILIYGDVSQRDTLVHAGIEHARVLICTIPDSILRGITNEKLVRQLRDLNPSAKIVVPAEQLVDVDRLYRAGADYVCVPRLGEAEGLCDVLEAIREGLLPEMRSNLDAKIKGRHEVLG